jgi:hypothetical protein
MNRRRKRDIHLGMERTPYMKCKEYAKDNDEYDTGRLIRLVLLECYKCVG